MLTGHEIFSCLRHNIQEPIPDEVLEIVNLLYSKVDDPEDVFVTLQDVGTWGVGSNYEDGRHFIIWKQGSWFLRNTRTGLDVEASKTRILAYVEEAW